MLITRYISSLDFSKPLIFLCGPEYNEDINDRRFILRNYILKKWEYELSGKKLRALPIIVDKIFNSNPVLFESLGIKVNILEEIVSNISYRTYIFLDTLSTSYELGQFTNVAYNGSNVKVFVDDLYEKRANNKIGEYLLKSFNGQLIRYSACYEPNNHIFFPKNRNGKPKIPLQILNLMNEDKPTLNNYTLYSDICFSVDRDDINKPGYIVYSFLQNKIIFSFSIKNLFYYVSAVYRLISTNSKYNLNNETLNESFISDFLSVLREQLLMSFINISKEKDYSFLIKQEFEIGYDVHGFDSRELVKHMLYLSSIQLLYKKRKEYLVAEEQQGVTHRYFSDELSVLGIAQKSLLEFASIVAKDENLTKAIAKRKLMMKNKSRNIVSYNNNYQGNNLKRFHKTVLESFINNLPTSNASFAYKKGCSTVDCIKRHENNNYFLKLDIHHYFESIRINRTLSKIKKYVLKRYSYLFNQRFPISLLNREIDQSLKLLLSPLFAGGTLPIGFISSPKISDFYLFNVDEYMKTIKDVVYTRYADDILISSNSEEALITAKDRLLELFEGEKLTINKTKTRYKKLVLDGDSFKFLGINIVKNGTKKRYTISQKYIVETSKLIELFINNRQSVEPEGIVGRINYIKYVSEESLNKLKNLMKIKNLRAPYLLFDCLYK